LPSIAFHIQDKEKKRGEKRKVRREGRRWEELGFLSWIAAVFIPHLTHWGKILLFSFGFVENLC
jgi:hypothetical protein